MSAALVLCVMLDLSEYRTRSCISEPDQAACQADMADWLKRWNAWQKRSGIYRQVLVVCGPAEIVG